MSKDRFLGDPIVIDPPGFSVEASWKECQDYVDRMRGAGREIAASFGADPGICSCPKCRVMYWCFGRRQRCKDCGFEYPTDAWAMYSWGVQAARPPRWLSESARWQQDHERKLAHPYYRYGFEHPVEDAYQEFERIDWATVLNPA